MKHQEIKDSSKNDSTRPGKAWWVRKPKNCPHPNSAHNTSSQHAILEWLHAERIPANASVRRGCLKRRRCKLPCCHEQDPAHSSPQIACLQAEPVKAQIRTSLPSTRHCKLSFRKCLLQNTSLRACFKLKIFFQAAASSCSRKNWLKMLRATNRLSSLAFLRYRTLC